MTTRNGVGARGALSGIGSVALVAFALTAVSQSPASGSHRNVTAVKGSAFGYHGFNITLFGGARDEVGPRPIVTLAPDASNSPQTATEQDVVCPGGMCPRAQFGPAVIWSAELATVSTAGSLGSTGSVTSTSDLQDLNTSRVEIFGEDNYDCCIPVGQPWAGNIYDRLDPPDGSGIAPQPPRPLTDVVSTCTANESGATGSTTITNGWLYLDSGWADGSTSYPDPADPEEDRMAEHDPVRVLVPTNPAPFTAYGGHLHVAASHQDDYVVVFNEQIQNPDGSLTVNALHYYFGYVLQDGQRVPSTTAVLRGELIVGQVVCGVTLDGTTSTTTSTTTTTVPTGTGTTTVSATGLETGQTFTASATGAASPFTPYVLRMGGSAAGCRTGTALGGTVVANGSGVIAASTRTVPTNQTSGGRYMCWVNSGDPSDHTIPVQVTIF